MCADKAEYTRYTYDFTIELEKIIVMGGGYLSLGGGQLESSVTDDSSL